MEYYEEEKPIKRRPFFSISAIIIFIIIVTSLSFGGYFYYKYIQLQKDTSVDAKTKQEAKDLLSKVASIYLIPTGEEPTIATVSDPNALKDQSFFSSSQRGDKVLIFTKAGKAVLYRPSINKIIETAPITKNDENINKPLEETSTPLKDKSF